MRAQLELGSYGDGRPDVPPASPPASPPADLPADLGGCPRGCTTRRKPRRAQRPANGPGGSEHGPPPRGGASSPTPQTCAAAQAARDSDVTLKRGSFGSYSHTSSKPILQKHLNVRMPLLPLFKQ